MTSSRALVLLLALLGLVAAACGDDNSTSAAAENATETTVNDDITVFAAASLTESFANIGEAFEVAHPDASVTFSFAASSTRPRR